MAAGLSPAPEQGQLVSVRSRNWIVNEVTPSALPSKGLPGLGNGQTLVSLASIEYDGLGDAYARFLAANALHRNSSTETVAAAALPRDVADAVLAAAQRFKAASVAVRSSAVAEDLPGASFAGAPSDAFFLLQYYANYDRELMFRAKKSGKNCIFLVGEEKMTTEETDERQ